ncbi:MAG: FMN reductase (NADH) RutF [Methanomassiliicoccales archaeon PtaU1.Bin030]|nr:MAG: FMN reductase (NADH) RutF [Methanomassiliicoccales archaeon PtaU1.Bin030]
MIDRRALHELTYGMYIIGAAEGGADNGQVSNTLFQVASEPTLVSVCINKVNRTHGMIKRSGAFAVSVLSKTAPMSLINLFGFHHGFDVEKFKEIPHRSADNGAPMVLSHTLAYIEVSVMSSLDAVTHTIFLGQVTSAGMLQEGEPMTYEFYRTVLKGHTPVTAPTFRPQERPPEIKG